MEQDLYSDADVDPNALDYDIHSGPPPSVHGKDLYIRLIWHLVFHIDALSSFIIANMGCDDVDVEQSQQAFDRFLSSFRFAVNGVRRKSSWFVTSSQNTEWHETGSWCRCHTLCTSCLTPLSGCKHARRCIGVRAYATIQTVRGRSQVHQMHIFSTSSTHKQQGEY